MRIVRVIVITVAVFLLAWAIKEMLGSTDAKKAEDLVQRIRMNGV
jgi:hypothetical protein